MATDFTIAGLLAYFDEACATFERDPADSDFQDGYQACLTTVRAEVIRPFAPQVRVLFASIKEMADSDETLLIWQTAEEEMKAIDAYLTDIEQVDA